MKTIGVANDHAGFVLKTKIVDYLQQKGCAVKNFGADTTESVDYPDYAHKLVSAIENGECEIGFALCYSGNGSNMTVNKRTNIRDT